MLTPSQIEDLRFKYGIKGSSVSQPKESVTSRVLSDIPSDIGETVAGVGKQVTEAGKNIAERVTSDQPMIDKVVGTGADLFRGIGRTIGEVFVGGAKALATPELEQATKEKVGDIAGKVIGSDIGQDVISRYESLSPDMKSQVDNLLGYTEGLTSIIGAGKVVPNITSKAISTTERGVGKLGDIVTDVASKFKVPDIGSPTSLFKKAPMSIDEAVAQADEALKAQNISQNVTVNVPETKIDLDSVNKRLDQLIAQGKTSEARALVEATSPQLTAKEMLIGLRPDIKQRIQGKQDLMREYIDVVNARNVNDTVPSVYEHGADYARKAADVMQTKLNETGGSIGASRKKLATYKAPIDEVKKIETSFANQLDKLNLELRNGVIQQKPGTISRTGATGDIKVLQELYDGLTTLKESPTLTNLIDLRSNFDAKINFAKRSSEVSNSVDPLSRQVRKDIAETASKVVGKSNAADLKRYSDFMDAYNDIHSYTDRKAGGEYLLRLVLSGRGGEARQLVQTIKEYTGIDLLDHATMMEVTNEMFGNSAQKNLFRQEATKAGLDVARLLGGDPSGAIGTLFEKGVDKFLDKERILMEASQKPSNPL